MATQYLSPSTLLGGPIPTPFDKKAILLSRKKLLAEIELTAGDSIEVAGNTLTKSDIIDYFEALQQPGVVDYHIAIEADTVLKDFLQAHAIQKDFRFTDNPLYEDAGFTQWISPYFLSAFTETIDISFRNTDDGQLSAILDNRLLMTDYDLEQAWVFISRILSNNIALLEYYKDNGQKGDFEEETSNTASHLMSFKYITLILCLPEDRFAEVRNKYAFVMEQSSICTFNKKKSHRVEAETWVENALHVAISPELKTELQNKLAEMRGISSKSKKRNAWNIVRVAWLLIFVLVKVFTCNTSNNTSTIFSTSKAPFIIKLNDSTNVIGNDTLRITRVFRDSANPQLRPDTSFSLKSSRLRRIADSLAKTMSPP